MAREHYRNGDPIELKECGCDGCSPARINGVLCHEAGCPYAWKDHTRECRECGGDFCPTDRHNMVCDDCLLAEEWEPDDCEPMSQSDVDALDDLD